MIGKVYGYNRIYKTEQYLNSGNDAIIEFCRAHSLVLERIYFDVQKSRRSACPKYTVLKEKMLHKNDILIVSEYDCLGSADQAKEELEFFQNQNIKVIFLDIPFSWQYDVEICGAVRENSEGISDFADKILIQFYETMAKVELGKRKKRQTEGIETLRQSGEWERYGRPRKMSMNEFREQYKRVEKGEISNNKLALELGMPFSRYYRYKKEMLKES